MPLDIPPADDLSPHPERNDYKLNEMSNYLGISVFPIILTCFYSCNVVVMTTVLSSNINVSALSFYVV